MREPAFTSYVTPVRYPASGQQNLRVGPLYVSTSSHDAVETTEGLGPIYRLRHRRISRRPFSTREEAVRSGAECLVLLCV